MIPQPVQKLLDQLPRDEVARRITRERQMKERSDEAT